MDSRIAMGQHYFTGFAGPKMTESFIRNVCEHKIGNVILFEHNVENKQELKKLCGEITALVEAETGVKPLIALDQEGGAISRLREDATIFPSAMAIAATQDTGIAFSAGRITALELRAMGISLNLAPVMDVNSNRINPVIGVRSYGDDPEQVALFGAAAARGLMDGGVLCCAKHFPGHGDTAIDSHIGLPVIEKTWEALDACELIPFRKAVDIGVSAVMTAHILFPALEPERIPATMSKRVIDGLLRNRMGFQGLVLTDCMMMDAIAVHYGTVEGSVAALAAGADMVFVSHDPALAAQAAEASIRALESGALNRIAFDESTRRILAVKASLAGDVPPFDDVGCARHRAVSRHATQAAITLVHDAPFALGASPIFLGCTRFRPTKAANPEDTAQCFPKTMAAMLGGDGFVTPPNPSEADIQAALAKLPGHSAVVIGLYNALACDGQLALARRVAESGLPVCAIALRAPYDLYALPAQVRAYAAYDYDLRTMSALSDVLAGRCQVTGRLPVKL